MTQSDYYEIESLKYVYLEDSYILDIREYANSIEFEIEAVLTEGHPLYRVPREGEKYCYRKARIAFPNVRHVDWVKRNDEKFSDATGAVDYGNIDSFYVKDGEYYVGGDFGEVHILSDQPALKFS